MDRKEFIKACSFSCLSLIGVSAFLESCTNVKQINATTEKGQLKFALSEFIEIKNEKKVIRKYIIARTPALNFPIVVYRTSDTEFSALLLECTHQGVELTVNGDLLSCSAHGSEFNNKGNVITGPADQNLKTFNVTNDLENIYIQLT